MENHGQTNPPTLDNINPYDGDPETQAYFHFGCRYLAHEQARKYESESVQGHVKSDYYRSCLNAVWPGHTHHLYSLAKGERFCLKRGSFKKDDELIACNNRPLFKASRDGHFFSEAGKLSFVFYAEDKPPMKLDVLKSLPLPEYKDMLNRRNSELEKAAMISRREQQVPDVIITLDSKKQKYGSFANLKLWIQSKFKLDEYDHDEIERLTIKLKRAIPNVTLFPIFKRGAMTHVLPFHQPYTLIPPNSTIARAYNPTMLSPNDKVHSFRYSTIIAEFTHQGSVYCLALGFDLKK